MKNAGEINGSTSDEEARLTAQKLLSFISIRTDPQANLIVIELVGSQKDSIPIYANSLARAFQKIEQDVKVKEEAKMRKFLKEKAEDRKKKFEQAELVLANLNQQRYSSGLSGNVNLKARRRAQLAFEEAKLEEDNRALETRMAEDSSESGDNPELKGLLLRRQLLQQQRQSLLDKYTEAHHEVVKINDQIDQVSLDIQAEASTLHDKRVRTLNDLLISNEEVLQTIRAEKSDLDLFFEELPNSEKKKAELETARDLEKSLYEMFRTRIEELELLHQTRPEAVIIRSPAGDSIKIFPDDDLLYSLCFTLAIIVGFGSGFLWELLDTSPKSIDEIEKYAGCSVVGVVPNIIFTPSENAGTKPMAGKPSEADPGAILHYQPRHPASEAFRSAASSLEFAFLTPEENNTICITSAAPGEGKTTASSNLSIALAHSGLKVLLVDACLRESGVTTLYNLSGRAGLKDAMEGFIPWRACVCPTSITVWRCFRLATRRRTLLICSGTPLENFFSN